MFEIIEDMPGEIGNAFLTLDVLSEQATQAKAQETKLTAIRQAFTEAARRPEIAATQQSEESSYELLVEF